MLSSGKLITFLRRLKSETPDPQTQANPKHYIDKSSLNRNHPEFQNLSDKEFTNMLKEKLIEYFKSVLDQTEFDPSVELMTMSTIIFNLQPNTESREIAKTNYFC